MCSLVHGELHQRDKNLIEHHWEDMTKSQHQKSKEVSVSRAGYIFFHDFSGWGKNEVRVTIKQSRPCLYIEDEYEGHFKKIAHDTFRLPVYLTYTGSYVSRQTHGEHIKQFMGTENCSMVGITERWDIEIKIDGKWVGKKYIKIKWVK